MEYYDDPEEAMTLPLTSTEICRGVVSHELTTGNLNSSQDYWVESTMSDYSTTLEILYFTTTLAPILLKNFSNMVYNEEVMSVANMKCNRGSEGKSRWLVVC